MRGSALHRHKPETFDHLEVASVIGQQSQPALKGGCPNEEIEIADQLAGTPEASPLPPEKPADVLIDAQDRHRLEKIVQTLLALLRAPRIEHTLVELCERHYRKGESLWPELPETIRGLGMTEKKIHGPISVHKIAHAHRRGPARVERRRSR